MRNKIRKILSILLCLCLIFEQSAFAQVAAQLDIAGHLNTLRTSFLQDKFRPLHLRYLSYDILNNNFKLLLDKGDLKNPQTTELENVSKDLLKYFFIGITLSNDSFWVNLRPDAEDNIIDSYLAQTDIGKIMLEADLQLKKDTARATSPETPEGKEYWDKLYKKAGEIFGYDTVTIPTLTRPWIVPDEIIIRESAESAYVYKATLKVMLEQDYLKDSAVYSFEDNRLKELNEYSSQLIRKLIIPKLTKEINTSKRYASLRQVYYSLILAQWFKARYANKDTTYSCLINRKDLINLTSKEPWSKSTYFNQYQKSFNDGEYKISEAVYTPYGQTIRSYFSGGISGFMTQPQVVQELTRPIGDAANKAVLPAADSPALSEYLLPGVSNAAGDVAILTQIPESNELKTRAEKVLGRSISDRELAAIEEAHLVGEGHYLGRQNPDGTFNKNSDPNLSYTPDEIRQKARILQATRLFAIDEIDKLIKFGIVGNPEPTRVVAEYFRMPNGTRIFASPSVRQKIEQMDSLIRDRNIVAEIGAGGLTRETSEGVDIIDLILPDRIFDLERFIPESREAKLAALIGSEGLRLDLDGDSIVLKNNEGDSLLLDEFGWNIVKDHFQKLAKIDKNIIANYSTLREYVREHGSVTLDSDWDIVIAGVSGWFTDMYWKKVKKRSDDLGARADFLSHHHPQLGLAVAVIQNKPYADRQEYYQTLLELSEGDKKFAKQNNIRWMEVRVFGTVDDLGDSSKVTNKVYDMGGSSSPIKDSSPGRDSYQQPTPQSSASHENPISTAPKNAGGIDFRTLPIVTQAISNLGLNTSRIPLSKLDSINLNQEWQEIKKMVEAGIVPSTERIKEYVQLSCLKGELNDKQRIVSCIADILRAEEECYFSTESILKDILVVLESGRSNQELKAIFTGRQP